MAIQVIRRRSGGQEFTFPVTATETSPLNEVDDISNITIEISFGTIDDEGSTWFPATVIFPTPKTAKFKMLIDNSAPGGDSWLWARITDGTEKIIRNLDYQVRII